MFKRLSFLLIFFTINSYHLAADPIKHEIWDNLLKKHVQVINAGSITKVNYAGFLQDQALLQTYLNGLAAISREDFDAEALNSQLAILINLYNAATVQLILSKYPEIDSIKDLGGFFQSPWKKKFISLFNEQVSLDEVEHSLIRGSDRYNDPRVHFAVNCASIGCPALRAEAFSPDNLETQLDEQTRLFLADNSRNYLLNNVLLVSSIFKWYREDFEKGWKDINSLEQFFLNYSSALKLNEQAIQKLKNQEIEIDYLDYDWRLNRT